MTTKLKKAIKELKEVSGRYQQVLFSYESKT